MAVLRALGIAVASLVVLLLGWEVGRLQQLQGFRPLLWVATTVASVLIVALALLLLAALPVWDAHIRCGSRGRLFWIAVALSAAAAFGVAFLARTVTSPTRLLASEHRAPVTVLFGHSAFDSFLLPFFEDGQSTQCKEITRGAVPEQAAAQGFLSYLVPAMVGCSREEARVRIDVLGFSSSSEFKNNCPDKDKRETLNVLLAERRRRAIIRMIRDLDKAHAIDIVEEESDHRWKDFDDMRQHQRIGDTAQGAVNPPRTRLTRRVQVVLKNLGACGI